MNTKDKSPGAMAFLNAMTLMFTGRTVEDCVVNGICPLCSGPVGDFRDEVSKREFEISGICQACQDKAFNTQGASNDEE